MPLGSRIIVRSSIFGQVCYVTRNEVFIYHSPTGSSDGKVLELLKAFSINLSESPAETNQTCKSLLKCKCRCSSVIFKRATEPLGPKVLRVPFILHYVTELRCAKLEWDFRWQVGGTQDWSTGCRL